MTARITKYVFLLFSSLVVFQAQAQYPTTGNKQRLGYQTTADGLIFRGNGSPAFTPTGINNAWTYIDTTAGTMYNYFAGSWHELETGGGVTMPFDSVSFNTTYTSQFGTGVMAYDPDNETVSVGIDGGATLQLGQELYYPLVINKSGALIKNGTPVMVDTATLTTGDHVRVMPAKNNGIIPSNYIMGVATTDIENDSTGLVTWFGYVREVKESDIAQTGVTLSIGNILYISATEAGKYTNVAPSTPYHKSTIALVVRKPTSNNITLLVRPWLAPRLADLSDVKTSSVTGLSVLRYNSSTSTWDASATAGIVAADTAAMLTPYVNVADTASMLNAYARGSATSGQVAYWNGTRSLTGSSNLTYSSDNITQTKSSGDLVNIIGTTSTTDTTARARIALYAGGESSSSEPTWRSFQQIVLPKQYKNALFGGSYAAGGGTLFMYGGGDTTNNNMTFAITNVSGISTANFRGSFRWLTSATNNYTVNDEIARLNRTGFGLKQNNPSYTLDINATDAIRLPSGTTVQRPTGAAAVLRFNSDSTQLEYHNGTSWRGIVNTWDAGTGGGGGSSVWSETADTVYLPSGKYVGIGTASPDQKLHVNGGVKASKIILDSGVDSLEFSNYAPAGSIGGNLIMGNGLLSSTSAAFGNIAIGLDALKNNTDGVVNTAIGASTLTNNTTGQQNLAIGSGNLYKNTIGRNNIAVGTNSAFLSVNPFTGSYNTFIGGAVFRAAENASFNIGIGQSAGRDLVNGDGNITIGYNAMRTPSSTVNNNIAIGTSSLLAISGNLNLAIGVEAGYRITSGADLTSASGSIFIGNDTRASAVANSNEIVIGGLARGQGSNTIMLGNSSISSLYCYDTSISSPSDERDKKDIEGLNIGIDFLKKLEPVAFTWNTRDGAKVGLKDVGFIAQQAKPAQDAEAQGENLKLVEYKEDADQYYMQYANLIPVLVKAIKEQQAQIDALKIEIENLKNK